MRTTLFPETPVRALTAARIALARLARDRGGAAMTEYVVVMGFVGLVSVPAFIYLGYVVANSFSFMRGYALYMYP
jgi:Flp pilus assembly pilin Flp